jgi:Domain of unknown function (DUF4148)
MKKVVILAASLFAIAASNAFADTSSTQVYQLPTAAVSVPSSQAPLTRAQVKQQLQELEAAGYQPNDRDINYPDDIQAAEQRVATEQVAQASTPADAADVTMHSEGSNGGSVSMSGSSSSHCVGPRDFCTPFFGH